MTTDTTIDTQVAAPELDTQAAPDTTTAPAENRDGEAVKNPAATAAKNRELLAKNATLTARVSELEAQLAEAHNARDKAAEAAGADVAAWRTRYQQEAVDAPLMAQIQEAAAGPARYLHDVCIEMGLLRMVPDDDGVNRPQWFDQHGNPADLGRGLHSHLSRVWSELHKEGKDGDLGHCVRGSGASGGGATGNRAGWRDSYSAPAPTPKPAPAPTPAFGLR